MLKKVAIVLLLVAVFNPFSQAQNAISDEVKKVIKQRVDDDINTGIVVGVIDDNGTHFFSYGLKSKETKEVVNEYSIFEIGSISKTFTSILLADMVNKGQATLEDDIQDYLPKGVTAPTYEGSSIKLKHLANHTSALPRMPNNFIPANPNNPYVDYPEELMFEFLVNHELTRPIGEKYAYSNFGAGLLGDLLAKKQNVSYEALMLEIIANPLNLINTRIVFSPGMKKNLAVGHSKGLAVENWDLTSLAGAGGIRSDAVDMLKYIEANMAKSKSKLYKAMKLSHQQTAVIDSNFTIALGWHRLAEDGLEIVMHSGATGGYRAFAAFHEGGNKGVVVLTNSDVSINDIGMHLLNSNAPLKERIISIEQKLRDIIDNEGIEAGVEAYWILKKTSADNIDFTEDELNDLGYYYLAKDEMEKALAVFKLNVEAFPESFNVYDSYGEALLEYAKQNYSKSVELDPSNQNGIDVLKKLGVEVEAEIETETEEIVVEESILESYVGEYSFNAGFSLYITKEGNQLKGQATGQAAYPIFPKSINVFHFKVVPAQLTFNVGETGDIVSVTLDQGNNHLKGNKVK